MSDERPREHSTDGERSRVLLALAMAEQGPRGDCPDPEEVLSWHEQLLSAEAGARIQSHVARCGHCYTLWTGLLETDSPALVAPAPRRRRWWQRLGLARPATSEPATARRRVGAVLAGALAAGLAVLAVVNFGWLGAPGTMPIPDYEFSIQGRALTRGAVSPVPSGPVALRNGNRFSVVLRPETAPAEPVAARAFLVENAALRELPAPPPRVMANGVVVFEGRVGEDVLLPAGPSTLVFVSGRAGGLPDPSDALRRLDRAIQVKTDDWVAWKIEVARE